MSNLRKQGPYIPDIPILDYKTVQIQSQGSLLNFIDYIKENQKISTKSIEFSVSRQEEYDKWYDNF